MPRTITLAIPEAPPRGAANPTADTTAGAAPATARPPAATLRLGILDNSKPNAELLLKGLIERSAAAARFQSVLFVSKPNAATHAPAEILDELAAGADLVISAMGD